MSESAAEITEQIELHLRLNAFHNRNDPETLGKPDDALEEARAVLAVTGGDERSIDLDDVERQAGQ